LLFSFIPVLQVSPSSMFVNTFNEQQWLPQSMFICISSSLVTDLVCYRYFLKMLHFFSSPPFYIDHVKLPHINAPIPPKISNNTKFHSFFRDALGTIDSTHINRAYNSTPKHVIRGNTVLKSDEYQTLVLHMLIIT
jgi:hypothetical protein